MIRAITIAVLTLTVTPAFAQEPVRIGAVSMAYVARSSKAGKSALAEIEKFVKQKESEAASGRLNSKGSRLPFKRATPA